MEKKNASVFLDFSVLEKLAAGGDDESTLPAAEVVELFLSVAPTLIFELRDLWKRREWPALVDQAERFKLSCESVGAVGMAETCVSIRRAANQAPEELKPLIEELFIVYSYVEVELISWTRRLARLDIAA